MDHKYRQSYFFFFFLLQILSWYLLPTATKLFLLKRKVHSHELSDHSPFLQCKTRNLHDFYSAQNGSRSRVKCFFLGSNSVTYYGLFCCIICLHCAIVGVNCTSVSQYYLSFKLSGKVVFFHLFCHLSFYFFAPVAFILELHRCSKGRLISSPNEKFLLFSKRVLLLIVRELSSGLLPLPLPFKVRITIDKQSPNGKLYDR